MRCFPQHQPKCSQLTVLVYVCSNMTLAAIKNSVLRKYVVSVNNTVDGKCGHSVRCEYQWPFSAALQVPPLVFRPVRQIVDAHHQHFLTVTRPATGCQVLREKITPQNVLYTLHTNEIFTNKLKVKSKS